MIQLYSQFNVQFMKRLLFFCFLLPLIAFSQEDTVFKTGVPKDLANTRIIFLQHEKVKVTADKKESKEAKYLYLRQTNHNKVILESNKELIVAAFDYPFTYALGTRSSYKSLLKAGYKYVLDSRAYDYSNLEGQPNEGELIIHEYFIVDVRNSIAYKVFELDEMKIYDSKLLMKKLIKAIKKAGLID